MHSRLLFHINIHSKEEAQSWLEQMMDHSKCTYRHTKGRAPGLKRVMFKAEMHCQHFKKSLIPRQQSQSAFARCKNARKALMHDVRNKKTECPSIVKLTTCLYYKSIHVRSIQFDSHWSLSCIYTIVFSSLLAKI